MLIWFLISIVNVSCFAEDYLPFKGVIRVETNVSGGLYSPFDFLNLAREKGIKIVIFADDFLRRCEYGIWPLQNLIKIKKEEPSVAQYGIKKYFERMNDLDRQFQDMVILAGVEAAPFYWWGGNPFEGKVFNYDWAKHLVVAGLAPKDYEYLPVISKRHILPQNLRDFISLIIPVSLIFLGVLLKLKIKRRILYLDYVIIILGVVFLINNFPFSFKYDAYHGNKWYKPYQEFIDYVRQKGGFIIWEHPGMQYSRSLGKADIISLPYFDALTNTFNYNAFAGLYTGDTSACFADREWDTVLKEFCLNRRKNPVWATGDRGFDVGLPKQIDDIQTIFLLPRLDRGAVFEALNKGRFYARTYEDNFYIDLEKFSLAGRVMGETARIENSPKLIIKGNANIDPEAKVKLEIIRGGEVAQTYEISRGEFNLEFIDNTFKKIAKKTYYRLNFFRERSLILVSNPIFCEVK